MEKRIFAYLFANFFNFACGTYYTPQFAGTMHNISAERSDDVAFICHIEHVGRNKVAFLKLDPPTLLTWQHKIFATKPHKYKLENPHNGDHNKWALHIINLQESDAGTYMCQVGTSPMISQTAHLFLKVPPKINADKTTHDMVVMESQNATLFCVADGSPTPEISWKRNDDAIIVTNDPEGFGEGIIYKPNLTIYKISRNHMADYICLADNGVMPADAWFVKIHVHFPPTVYPLALEHRVVGYVSHDVKLQCKAEAWPRQEFKWFFQHRMILANNTKYQMLLDTDMPFLYESLSVLIIRSLTKEDFGAYYCVAKNEYGEQKATVELIRKDNNEQTFEKETNVVNKIASNDKYVDDSSGAGSGDNNDDLETLLDDDDYYENITSQFQDSKTTENDDDGAKNEIKQRQQPPPYDHQSDDRSSKTGGNSSVTSNKRFTLMSLRLSFVLILLYAKNIMC